MLPKSTVLVAALSCVAVSAQNNTNPLIPASVSATCQSFLQSLNGDTQVSECTRPILDALGDFAPSSNSDAYTQSSEDIHAVLSSVCSYQPCDQRYVRSLLTQFEGNCSAELDARQPVVLGNYDILYILPPLHAALCSKDSQGGFCLSDITSGHVPADNVSIATNASENASPFRIQDYASNVAANPKNLYHSVVSSRLARRQSEEGDDSDHSNSLEEGNDATPVVGNTTVPTNSTVPSNSTINAVQQLINGLQLDTGAWTEASLPFLFLSPNMSTAVICTQCTKDIFSAYIAWETSKPYYLGLANSALLGRQGRIWSGIGQVCGSGFLSSIATQAGQNALGAASTLSLSTTGLVGSVLVGLLMVYM